jgi:hypothetical protein
MPVGRMCLSSVPLVASTMKMPRPITRLVVFGVVPLWVQPPEELNVTEPPLLHVTPVAAMSVARQGCTSSTAGS